MTYTLRHKSSPNKNFTANACVPATGINHVDGWLVLYLGRSNIQFGDDKMADFNMLDGVRLNRTCSLIVDLSHAVEQARIKKQLLEVAQD